MVDKAKPELTLMSLAAVNANVWVILQMALAMLFAAAAFGVVLSAMMLRSRLPAGQPLAGAFDIAALEISHTERAYQLASILASAGAMASLLHAKGAFAAFVGVAVSFQLAEHWLIPRLKAAAADGGRHYIGVRARMEMIQAAALALIFVNLGVPPLVTLANIYGLP